MSDRKNAIPVQGYPGYGTIAAAQNSRRAAVAAGCAGHWQEIYEHLEVIPKGLVATVKGWINCPSPLRQDTNASFGV